MSRKRAEIILFVLALVVIILVGMNAQRYFFRVDLTRNKVYTISKVSKSLFQEIPDQVFVTYYVSEKLQSLYPFPTQIEDLLHEYAAFSRGKIRIEVKDPVASGELSQAEALGVFPQQMEVVERNERTVAQVYSGIVIQYLDRYETLPLAYRMESLEYELTSKIRKVVVEEDRVVGLLNGQDERNTQQDYLSLMQSLSAEFRVVPVDRGQTIPDEVTVLFVLGNYDLDMFDLYPIDQYIMNGGRVLFAVEGVRIDLMRGLAAAKIEDSPLLDMLEAYGVGVKREYVLDKYCQNFRIPTQAFGQVMWQIMDKYPHWITIADQFVSRDNPVTARFSGLDLYWVSPLELLQRQGVEIEALIQTTPEAWIMSEPLETDPGRVGMLRLIDHENAAQQTVAATLSGSFDSYFAGREIPRREGEVRDWADTTDRSADTRIIVVGDTDFLTELYQYTDARYNLEFAANTAEWLSNADDLLQIKTRTTRDMRLNRIQNPEQKIRAALFTQVFSVVFIPLLVIAYGVIRRQRRRKKVSVEGAE